VAKPYSPPALSPTQRKAVENGEYDFLIPTRKPLMRMDEVCDAIRRSPNFVRALMDNGRLEAHRDSAKGDRLSSLITRRSVILYLAETSGYDTAFIVMRIEVVMKTLRAPALDRITATARKLRERLQ
jgi:hypothetical protein